MKRFKKLLVATDTRLNEHPVVEEAGEIALQNKAALTIVPDEALLSRRLSKSHVAEFVEDHRQATRRHFDEFMKKHGSCVDSEDVQLIEGRVPETIETFVREKSVDLVVMGTVARSGLSGMLLGNTAEQVLDRIECSVLALKPYEFTSPVTLKRGRETRSFPKAPNASALI